MPASSRRWWRSHPLAIAKRYGTLDRVSGGRLTLGLGVGSLEEKFDLADAFGLTFEETL